MKTLWIVVAVVTLVAAIHQTYFEGFANSLMFYGLSVIAFLMFLVRKKLADQDEKNTTSKT